MSVELSTSYPKARKEYRCEWCNTLILRGEKHLKRVYIFEDFQSGRQHLECEQAMNKSPWDLVSEGWMPGEAKRGEILT